MQTVQNVEFRNDQESGGFVCRVGAALLVSCRALLAFLRLSGLHWPFFGTSVMTLYDRGIADAFVALSSFDKQQGKDRMRLEDAVNDVALHPGSVKRRVNLAAALQHFQMPGAAKVWEATAIVAAAKGDFFNALAIIRLHIPGAQQAALLTEIVKHYVTAPGIHDQPPPQTPVPIQVQLPSNPRDLLQVALQLGTALPGIHLSTHLKMPEFPIFGDLPEQLLLVLAQNMVPVPLKKGELLLRQGTRERACYFLTHGKLRVLKEIPNKTAQELAHLNAPTLIGEISLLTNISRRATILASTQALAWRIDAPLLEHLGRMHSTLIAQIRTLIRMRLVMNLLKSGEIFSRVSEKQRYELLQAFNMHEIEPGREIVQRHQQVNGLFVNMHGEAVVEVNLNDGRVHEAARLTEGSLFGAASFFSGEPSRTSIRMPEGGLLLQLTPRAYQLICQRFPHLDQQLKQQKYPY